RVERLKRAKNAWECFDEIRRFAREGHASIPAEWLGTYFRPWGVYTQGDGAGAIGGQGGEGKAVPYFRVRIRVPSSLLLSHQLRALADITEQHARGVADLTVRQNVQLHWVTIESLPEVFEALWRVGLTTMGACGDDTRNITGCPLAGVDAEEVCDASPLVQEATRLLVGNGDFYNLPRKFKISITGCRVWCSFPEINDVGLTALTRTLNGHPEVGFSLRFGGAVLLGASRAEQMRAAADLADRFASGELRTTSMQNLVIVNVPRANADVLARELGEIGLRPGGSPFWRGAVACTGTEFCKLAITETKSFTRWLVEELEERMPGFDQSLKLNIAGCPNSCGQHWIADLGLEGKKIKVDGHMVDA